METDDKHDSEDTISIYSYNNYNRATASNLAAPIEIQV